MYINAKNMDVSGYYDVNEENQVMGYPVSLLGFLKPYIKARF